MFDVPLAALSRVALGLVVVMVGTSSLVAVYEAPEPGAALKPVDSAAEVVRVDQDATSIRFEAVDGVVDHVAIQGWPSLAGGDELGGAFVVVAIGDRSGSVAFGDLPRSVEFSLSGRVQPVSK